MEMQIQPGASAFFCRLVCLRGGEQTTWLGVLPIEGDHPEEPCSIKGMIQGHQMEISGASFVEALLAFEAELKKDLEIVECQIICLGPNFVEEIERMMDTSYDS